MTKRIAGLALFTVALIFTGCQTAPRLASPTTPPPETLAPTRPVQRGANLQPQPTRKPDDSPLVQESYRWLGVPYRVGGMTQAGVDCSGFTCAIYLKMFSVKLPRTSLQQFSYGRAVPLHAIKEGDLVFFQTSNEAPVTHVGIYLSEGRFIHSSTKRGVIVSRLDEGYYSERFRGARRVLQTP